MADLSKIDAKDVPAADVLIGGFPCQEFSSCGPLGGLDSERGQLYKTLLRYMKEHSPKVVVGENVINLVQTRQAARLYIINTGRKHNGRLLKAFTDFNNLAQQTIEFCHEKGIAYHIKSGTITP